MSGPKHLWSGDWERESQRAAEQRGTLPDLPASPVAEPETDPQPPRKPRSRLSRQAAAYFAIVLVIALGAGIALASALGGSRSKHPAKKHWTVLTSPPKAGPSGGAPVQAAPTSNGPTADWMGMQIVTSPSGAVVNSVRLGSDSDAAGFQPGDVFDEINGQPINSVAQIRGATARFKLGSGMQVELNRGSAVITVGFPLRQRPTIQP